MNMRCRHLLRRLVALAFCLAALLGGAPARGAEKVEHAAGAAHTIMSGDRLRIRVDEAPTMSRVYPVAGDGTIDFGILGRTYVEGLSPEEAAGQIEQQLESRFFKKATVAVEVADFVEGSILVLGEVKNPGLVAFRGDEIMTLVELIAGRGGMTDRAAASEVRILRWKREGGMRRDVITVDVASILKNLNFEKDQFLRPRDIVMVPSLGKGDGGGEFLALGEFGAPGFHPHFEGLDVIRAVAAAGGINREAKMDAGRLLRPDGSGQYRVIPLDYGRLFGAADMQMNVPVMAGDIMFIASEAQSTAGKVYLLGEVSSPGILPIPSDRQTTLARTLLTGGGFTKFANTARVRILREGPDRTKQTLEVDVGKILKTGDFDNDVPLRDEDVVIVPERMLF